MNAQKLVKLMNIIGIVSIILLAYWVFTFTIIEVFGFKIFRRNMTMTFYLSIFGILAMMAGALMINIMLNLTRIAEGNREEEKRPSFWGKTPVLFMFLFSFPFLAGLLYLGDAINSDTKKRILIKSAQSVIERNEVQKIAAYRFDWSWINETADLLKLMSRLERSYNTVSVIVRDEINDIPVYLEFSLYSHDHRQNRDLPKKNDFIARTSLKERAWLDRVFSAEQYRKEFFTAHDGSYALYYPYSDGNQVVVFHFSDRMSYGKLGS